MRQAQVCLFPFSVLAVMSERFEALEGCTGLEFGILDARRTSCQAQVFLLSSMLAVLSECIQALLGL
jgi:hypothetical protein